jgi:hypothetical protein
LSGGRWQGGLDTHQKAEALMTEDDGKLDLQPAKANTAAGDAKRNANFVKAGIGIGIGSAAIVAALLYANHNRKKQDDTGEKGPE